MPERAIRQRLACLAVGSVIAWPAAAQSLADETEPPTAAYIVRGDMVEATYEAYVERLQRYQARLREHLETDAPDLAEKLKKEPPTPVPYGYQIVPDFTLSEATVPTPPRSGGYNWPWTNQILNRQQTALANAEQQLDQVDGMTPETRRQTYEALTDGYDALEAGQRQVDQHLKHNRFWQQVIADDWGRFERQIILHDAVVEREQKRHQLATLNMTPESVETVKAQIAALDTQIEEGQPDPAAPAFIEIVENSPQRKLLRVPLYTDIPDAEFVASSVEAIEAIWQVENEGVEYRLEVDLRTVTAADVYGEDPTPEDGAHILLNDHAARFPKDGGVLTTGSNRTYAIPGRYIAVGPSPISNRTMAHEFGHILGFTDRYVRGARDMGRAGYNILEIVPDGRDLMAATNSGFVRASHFESLIRILTETSP